MSTWLIRFQAVCHHIKYRVLRGTNGVVTIIGILFCVSICLASHAIPFHINHTKCCIWWPPIAQFMTYPTSAKLVELHYFSEQVTTNYFLIVYIIVLTAFVILFIVNCYMFTETIKTLITRKHNRTLQTSAQFKRHIDQTSVMVVANGKLCMRFNFCIADNVGEGDFYCVSGYCSHISNKCIC